MPALAKYPHMLAVMYKLAELEERFGPELRVIEIGVLKADLTSHILAWFEQAVVTGIDPWVPYSTEGQYDAHDSQQDTETWNRWQRLAKQRVAKHGKDRCTLMQMTSADAAKALDGQTFHLIFIDGLHTQKQVWADIVNYQRLLYPNGIMGGHDLCDRSPGVEKALKSLDHYYECGVGETWWYPPK